MIESSDVDTQLATSVSAIRWSIVHCRNAHGGHSADSGISGSIGWVVTEFPVRYVLNPPILPHSMIDQFRPVRTIRSMMVTDRLKQCQEGLPGQGEADSRA